MKIFVYTFLTNYGDATFVIVAPNREKADKIADDNGAWADNEVTEIDPTTLSEGIKVEKWPTI